MSDSHKPIWKIQAYTGKNRDKNLASTLVRASSEVDARELGRKALRVIGVRGRFQVSAVPYHPQCDLALVGYIKKVQE